ncbi:MAG: M50 family metallopeptidase [Myxococcota bacterium]
MATRPRLNYGRIFWSVVVFQLVLSFLPMNVGGLILYPFSVLSTWTHELGHAMAALLVGGAPRSVQLFIDTSGVTQSAGVEPGVRQAIVSLGGLLGAPLAGVMMLAVSATPRGALVSLVGLTAFLTLALVLLMGNATGWVLGGAVVALLALGTWKLDREKRFALAQLVALQLLLSVWSGRHYLFAKTAYVDGNQFGSDTEQIANALGGTHFMWGVIVGAIDIALLYGAYRFVRWRLARDERAEATGLAATV